MGDLWKGIPYGSVPSVPLHLLPTSRWQIHPVFSYLTCAPCHPTVDWIGQSKS